MHTLHNILIIRLSSIGDIILTTPLLRCVRNAFPDATITFVVKKQYAELLSSSPHIDHLIAFDHKKGFSELKKLKIELRAEKFDLFIDIHKNLRSFYLRAGIGAKKVTSYGKKILNRSILIRFHRNLYKEIKPVYLRFFESVQSYHVKYDGLGTEIPVSEDKSASVKKILHSSGYNGQDYLIAICPSATYLNKKWLPERFIEMAQHLVNEFSAFITVLGGRDDVSLCDEIAKQAGKNVCSFAGQFSLLESAALLGMCKLVVANDTGMLHLAESQNVPVTGIYGPTVREFGYFPILSKSEVVENTRLYCRPCTSRGLNHCPQKHFRCMKEIRTEQVISAVRKIIS